MSFVPVTPRRSPYQGLIPYNEGDARFFFGREKDTRIIIANLFASSLTLVYGASGVGKSSVLRAGVVHQLRQRDDLVVVVFSSWQSNPTSRLADAIADDASRAGAIRHKVPTILRSTWPACTLSLSEYLTAWYDGRRFMILLDQFEEYFLYPQEEDFENEFAEAVLQTEVPVSFLISIREDSLAKLDRFEGRIPSLFDNYLRVDHLNRDAGREAITKPVNQFNDEFLKGKPPFIVEPLLVDEVLDQVETGQVALGEAGRGVPKTEATQGQIETPFLQMVMMRLWTEEVAAGSHLLQLKTLIQMANEETGESGAERIVRTHLDEKMSAPNLEPEEQDIAAAIFHYLVTPSRTKIAHTVDDLAEYAKLPPAKLVPMLERLAEGDTRILRGVPGPANRPKEIRYEIYHDALAAPILDWRTRHLRVREQEEADRVAEARAKEAASIAEAQAKEAVRRAETQAREEEKARTATRMRWAKWIGAAMLISAVAALGWALNRQIAVNREGARVAQLDREKAEQTSRAARAEAAWATQRANLLDQQTVALQSEQQRTEEQRQAAEANATKARAETRRALNNLKKAQQSLILEQNDVEKHYQEIKAELTGCDLHSALGDVIKEYERLQRQYPHLSSERVMLGIGARKRAIETERTKIDCSKVS